MPSRRRFIAGAGATVGAGTLGWAALGDDESSEHPAIDGQHIERRSTAWPSFNNARRSVGYAPGTDITGTEPTVAWEVEVGRGDGYPVVFDGLVVYPDRPGEAAERGRQPMLRAFDAEDGTEAWHEELYVTAPPTICYGPELNAGRPLVVVGAETAPQLRAYTLDGDPAWQTETPDGGDVVGGPAYDPGRGRLYVGTTAGRVVCVDAATGDERWRQEVFGEVRAGLTIGNRSNTRDAVFVATEYGTSAGAVFALDAHDGDEVWATTVGNSTYCAPAAVGSLAFVLDVDGVLYCLDGREGTRWRSDLTSEEGWRHRGLASDGETLYVAAEEGTLRAVDARSGETTWSHDLEVVRGPSTYPGVVTDDTLYVPTSEGIVALRTGGTGIVGSRRRWEWTSGSGPIVSNRVVAAGGRLYAVESTSGSDRLLALE